MQALLILQVARLQNLPEKASINKQGVIALKAKVMTYTTALDRVSFNEKENLARSSSNSTVFLATQNLTFAQDSEPIGLKNNSEPDQADNKKLSNTENHLNEGDNWCDVNPCGDSCTYDGSVLEASTITDELHRLESRIEKGLRAFWEIGQSLSEIRDQRLYRQNYKTFDEYCLERWEMSRRSVYQLIDAASVYENVRHGAQILPANERQVRPLVNLPPEKQREAWAKAVSTAPNGKVTASHVAQVAREYHRENSTKKSRQKDSFEQEHQSTEDSQKSLIHSCWNCLYCSWESVKDDPQSFYCDRLGKLSFVEKDGNQRGAECEYWTYRFGESSQVRKNVIPLRKTFNLTLQLPARLQPLIQDAAKQSDLAVIEWVAKLVEDAICKNNDK